MEKNLSFAISEREEDMVGSSDSDPDSDWIRIQWTSGSGQWTSGFGSVLLFGIPNTGQDPWPGT